MRKDAIWIKVVFCIVLSLAAACSDDRQQRLSQVIVEYNRAIIAAYQSGTAKGLLDIAAEKEVNKVQVLIDLKSSNGLVLESELQNLELLSLASVTPTDYTVRTKERWKYFDRPLKAGSTAGPLFIADMLLEYTVHKENNKWKVVRVKAEKTDYLETAPLQKK